MQTINFILSISLISTFFWVGINGLPINFAMAETTSEKRESPRRSRQKLRDSITDRKPPVPEREGGSRDDIPEEA